jgi:hypothetical protein
MVVCGHFNNRYIQLRSDTGTDILPKWKHSTKCIRITFTGRGNYLSCGIWLSPTRRCQSTFHWAQSEVGQLAMAITVQEYVAWFCPYIFCAVSLTMVVYRHFCNRSIQLGSDTGTYIKYQSESTLQNVYESHLQDVAITSVAPYGSVPRRCHQLPTENSYFARSEVGHFAMTITVQEYVAWFCVHIFFGLCPCLTMIVYGHFSNTSIQLGSDRERIY